MRNGPDLSKPFTIRLIAAAACLLLLLFSGMGVYSLYNTAYASTNIDVSPAVTDTPTDTPIPPTDTPIPPTDTPIPPTATPTPTKTPPKKTPTPRPTNTPIPRLTPGTTPIPVASSTAKATKSPTAAVPTPTDNSTPTATVPVVTNTNNSGPGTSPPPAGGNGGSGTSFLPLILGAVAFLLIFVIVGTLMLRKFVRPEPIPASNLPPSGARPWRRTRNPESLHDDQHGQAGAAAAGALLGAGGWQRQQPQQAAFSPNAPTLQNNATMPNGNLGNSQAAFPPLQQRLSGSYPSVPLNGGLRPQANMGRPQGNGNPAANNGNFLFPTSNLAPTTGELPAASTGGLAATNSGNSLFNGNLLFPNDGLPPSGSLPPLPLQSNRPQAGQRPAANNGQRNPQIVTQGNTSWQQPLDGGQPNQSRPLPPQPNQPNQNRNFGQASQPLPPNQGAQGRHSAPLPPQADNSPSWLANLENDPYLAQTIKEYTDKGRAAQAPKKPNDPKQGPQRR